VPVTVVAAGPVARVWVFAMTRQASVEIVGQVRIFGPTEKCRSYRLRWTERDGTPGDTTAGSDPAAAIAKATALDQRLSRAAGPAAMTPLGEIFTQYLAEGCSPYSDRPWRSSTRTQIEDNLGRALRGHEHMAALDLDRAGCDRMRAQLALPTWCGSTPPRYGRSCSGATGTPPATSPPSRSSTSPPAS
jgi:hypothetical protein